ncbi:MAG: hypothetical protein ACRCZZ_05895, partial [Phocaeicola sp.]
ASAIPLAMVAGGLMLQKRDTEDASVYAGQGETGKAIETFLLGDRKRLTEENANSELGRATGKNALLAGGIAGTSALALGGVSAGLTAGATAAAGGAGIAGVGLASAGATLGAVVPPILIATAIAAGVTAIAKGTQEAYELGWDKNQAEIQRELYTVINSEDASFGDKFKATFSSKWKNLTGVIAGGIRSATEEIAGNTAIEWQRGLEYLEKSSAEGNTENARLLEMLKSDFYNDLSKKEQKQLLQAEGLMDEYSTFLSEGSSSALESVANGFRTVGSFFKGAVETSLDAFSGKQGGKLEAEALKDFQNLTGDDIQRLKESSSYLATMNEGGDHKKAMETAYLAEVREKNVALGVQKEDGSTIGIQDTILSYLKQDDDSYRQSREFQQKKALLMMEGKTSEEADLQAVAEYNALYEKSLEYRLKSSDDYKKHFKRLLAEGKSMKDAEAEALKLARENKKNTMTVNELVQEKFSTIVDSVRGFASSVGDKAKDVFGSISNNDLTKSIASVAQSLWSAITEWFGNIGEWASGSWSDVMSFLSGVGSGAKDAVGGALDWAKEKAGNVKDGALGLLGITPDATIDDGIVTKDGKVIKLSPDDNVYATKNEPTVMGDRDVQKAMPDIAFPSAEFTDENIVKAIQTLTEVLIKKNMTVNTGQESSESINFEQFRTAT